MPFYEHFGFRYERTIEGFFLNENYGGIEFDEPGLADMEILSLTL